MEVTSQRFTKLFGGIAMAARFIGTVVDVRGEIDKVTNATKIMQWSTKLLIVAVLKYESLLRVL